MIMPSTQYTVRFIYFILLLILGIAFLNYIFYDYIKCLHDSKVKCIEQDIIREF